MAAAHTSATAAQAQEKPYQRMEVPRGGHFDVTLEAFPKRWQGGSRE